jgi:hypothetical protein
MLYKGKHGKKYAVQKNRYNNDSDPAERRAQTGMEFRWIIEEVRTNRETEMRKSNYLNYLYKIKKAMWFSTL